MTKKFIETLKFYVWFIGILGSGIALAWGSIAVPRINDIAEKKIRECPQVQRVDTIYKVMEANGAQHAQIIAMIKELSDMTREMNRGDPRFEAYYRIRSEPSEETTSPRQVRRRADGQR